MGSGGGGGASVIHKPVYSPFCAKVVDIDSGELLGPGERGELHVSGPQVMKGYYRNQAATDKTIEDGWLMTGDIATYDENGHFTIVDRLKELIKVKGMQVRETC